jgi:hypothetical protein
MNRRDKTIPKHKHLFNPTGVKLDWSDEGMFEMEKVLARMTPAEQECFGKYTLILAHTGNLPEVYWNQSDGVIDIVFQPKRYLFNWTLYHIRLSEPEQVHISVDDDQPAGEQA